MQDGFVKPSLLQALSPQKVLRDRDAQGVHSDRGRESVEATED